MYQYSTGACTYEHVDKHVNVAMQYSVHVHVRYQCGGRPMKINACVLNSYMVYL
jgi:hypothetical protein